MLAQPILPPTGVVNTADYSPSIAPGMLISVFGSGFSSGLTVADKTPLPTTLGGATLELNDGSSSAWTPLPLFFVSPSQINAHFPFAHEGRTIQLRVRNSTGASASASIQVQLVAPRLLTKSMDGRGEALLTDAVDYKLVTAAVPARGGEYLTLYLTGLGAVSGAASSGKPGGDNGTNGPLNVATAPVGVTIGGKPAQVLWAGLAPGWIGLYQVNVQVSSDTPSGQQAISVSAKGVNSQDGVSITVGDPVTRLSEALITAAAGGIVSGGGAQVRIPSGAIPVDTTVRLSRASRDPVQNQASDVYVIRGLPSSLTAPVEIVLPTNASVDPSKVLILTRQLWGGGDAAQPQSAQVASAVVGRPADSVSLVTAILPLAPEPPVDQTDTEIETLVLENFARLACPGGFFDLFYPDVAPTASHAPKICDWLNEAKQKLESDVGLVFGVGRRRWPFRAVYMAFPGNSPRWGEHVPGANGDSNYDSINLNLEPVKKALAAGLPWEEEMRATIGHELFHFVQNTYDARPKSTVAKVPSRDLWFEEALSTWFEGVMLGQDNYISYAARTYAWPSLFQHEVQFSAPAGCTWGLLRVARSAFLSDDACAAVQDHGYAASLLLRTIVKNRGAKVLGDALQRAVGSGNTGAQALLAVAPALPGYWTTVARGLVESNFNGGEKWPPPSALPDIARKNGTEFRLSATDPARKSFTDTWSARDLSMRLDRITLEETLPVGTQLTIKFAQSHQNVAAYVYRYDLQGTALLDVVSVLKDTVVIANADQLGKTTLLILIVQSRCLDDCTGSLPVSLNIQASGLADWVTSTTRLNVDFRGKFTFRDSGGVECRSGVQFGTIDLDAGFVPISWDDLTFTASASGPGWPDNSRTVSYILTGTLDKTASVLTTLAFQETSSTAWNYRFNVTALPIASGVTYSSATKLFRYRVTGSAAAAQAAGTMVSGACTGTWTPATSQEGVEVTLYRP